MDLAIRVRLMWAFVLFLFVVVLGLAAAMEPGAATATAPAASTEGLDRLRVAPEGPRTGYSRDRFPHWVDADGDGCNTREEVLIAESASPAQVDPHGCTVVAGPEGRSSLRSGRLLQPRSSGRCSAAPDRASSDRSGRGPQRPSPAP